jgi:hypothetical protein
VGVDEPELLDGFAFGDCVRLRYSAQELLSSVDHAANECRRV